MTIPDAEWKTIQTDIWESVEYYSVEGVVGKYPSFAH